MTGRIMTGTEAEKLDPVAEPELLKKEEGGLLSIINHLPSTLEAPHCGERSTAV
jgi:hypothetical protein